MAEAFREPTKAEQRKLEKGKKLIQEGVRDQKDWFLGMFPTFRSQAAREESQGRRMLDEVPEKARNYEAYKEMTYMKEGGSVSSASKRADGCAERGKTKGRFV